MNCSALMGAAGLVDLESTQAEILVATTWHCNLGCSYCFVRESELMQRSDPMSPALASRVIDALDQALSYTESICVHLYGGEPLMNLSAIEAMVTQAATKKTGRFTFAVTTNGTITSQAAIDLLGAGHFQVILSIDGPAEIHDQCRRTLGGKATHARVLNFLELLRKQTDCWVRGSAVARSGWSLAEATQYLSTLPVDTIKAQAVRGPPGTPFALTEMETQAYLEDLEGIGQRIIAELEAGQIPRDDRFSSRVLQLLAGVKRSAFCGAGYTTFGITPTGYVLPCVLMEVEGCLLGHINDEPTSWLEAGHHWRAAQPERDSCRGCAVFTLCGGGCPAIMPICGAGECNIIRKNCQVATTIYEHFKETPETLLALAGII